MLLEAGRGRRERELVYRALPISQRAHVSHSHELGRVGSLHAHYLVVAGAVVERVGALREVVHDVVAVQRWDPGAVVPREGQKLLLSRWSLLHSLDFVF